MARLALMVMPISRSRSMSSRYCSRISRFSTAPQASSRRSARVLLPWSMWAMIEKLRIRAISIGLILAEAERRACDAKYGSRGSSFGVRRRGPGLCIGTEQLRYGLQNGGRGRHLPGFEEAAAHEGYAVEVVEGGVVEGVRVVVFVEVLRGGAGGGEPDESGVEEGGHAI